MTGGAKAGLHGLRVLLVEDDFLVAETMRDLLEDMGVKVVGPIGWLAEVLAFIETNPGSFDVAVIDINLHGATSYPIADLLCAHDIPFVFTTGYGSGAINERYRRHPRCEKPISRADLAGALARPAQPGAQDPRPPIAIDIRWNRPLHSPSNHAIR